MWQTNKIGKEQIWYEAELIEKIKAMNIDEMVEFLKQHCALLVAKKAGSDYVDEDLVKQWLESEVRE